MHGHVSVQLRGSRAHRVVVVLVKAVVLEQHARVRVDVGVRVLRFTVLGQHACHVHTRMHAHACTKHACMHARMHAQMKAILKFHFLEVEQLKFILLFPHA